jgi:hypothetical protein
MKPLVHVCVAWSIFVVGAADAQTRVPWTHVPTIASVSAKADDDRAPLVDEAVAFWNKTLQGLGSGFRLGPVKRVVGEVPEAQLQRLSRSTIERTGEVATFTNQPGDITIFLADSVFVSVTGPMDANHKRVIGIRSDKGPPLNLPNTARNVIAHELGHAIGLGHNSDPAMLMCGRPAACRPDAFQSEQPRMFPLTDGERRRLLELYPQRWKPTT